MAHALRLAARGLGNVWPNPAVGCVLVRDGVIVGRGWTQPGGRPHAEVRALSQAGPLAEGATAYVTLEPCAHHGHTPPCADALIAARVARVVTALTDPDPRVSGKGHAMLRAAGIAVTEGVMASEATHLNAGFLKRVTQGLPFVTLKLAASLDGRTATATGESRWITGPDARRKVHAMRLAHDAVMVGSGTALADDPDLTVRDMGTVRQPIRIVLDRMLRHSPDSRLGSTAKDHPVWLLHGPSAPDPARKSWEAVGATLIEIPETDGHLDLKAALQTLASKGLTRIFSEGGGTVAAALVKGGLLDELAMFSGGVLIGSEGHAALGQLMLRSLSEAARTVLLLEERVGNDTFSRWRLALG
ncbi:bifunctional diaminohydroxyphosphoribosylaminopyrimidine deaminase/5-amino-6-(5-phosphoribosylamino)uracil reductase RibD [Tabrizicola piscis]|uniref:Riboflavin biosynthesis protein RibD n=1 Tax=Tabrizicola piscis TaxID=2494374 RepID=A0A3S8UCG4_9RHOB|nr:bifunctional diaminohydroxyphosphoribosylaminopyrimidine deaminase/5-amino-6-(5-phosphoribosylamino)uracil reductase RibD [Tabrizicola piscis]AZL61253.1 bifunctional diaminohydroxyphosphoribosylaminopyrimidine deaminase/5-amino-6-(5-phosphoribosylamino)uracil reductase RibD [Tabrizicola piscis]